MQFYAHSIPAKVILAVQSSTFNFLKLQTQYYTNINAYADEFAKDVDCRVTIG